MREIAVGFKELCLPKLCYKGTYNSVMCAGHHISRAHMRALDGAQGSAKKITGRGGIVIKLKTA